MSHGVQALVGHRSDAWSGRQWLGWMLAPVILLVGLLLAVELLSHWHPNRYWAIQRAWFVVANEGFDAIPAIVWSHLTMLGDGAVLLCLASPLLLWRPQAWAAMLGAAPLSALLSADAKHLFSVPRPAAVLDPHTFSTIGHTLSAHNSLPSGHAITVFAGAIAVLAVLTPRPRRWREGGLILAVLVVATVLCASRVAVGAHWPLDVVVGAAGGWFAGLTGAALTRRYRGWWQFTKPSKGRYVLATLVLILSIWLLSRAMEGGPDTFMLYLSGLTGMTVAALVSLPFLLGPRARMDSAGR